ncbi:hypothetical protein Tco_0804479 [Tanacetum coccineum]|uniref:Reverse transcriptase domain-containing protein n=1 Tax=Tanacetum coccineum TaxID=301880 RepID=A0ABQ5A6Y4_9ASTR
MLFSMKVVKSSIPLKEPSSKKKLFVEFDEFMAMTTDENSKSESDTEEPPFKKITFNTDYKIKTSLEEPHMDLELKPLPDNLEYVFLKEPSFLPMIISSQLSEQNKNKLVSVLKRHNQAFAWKTTDIPRICPSFLCSGEWEPIEEERLEEPKEGWMLGESKKRSIWIFSRMLIVGLVPRSQVTLVKVSRMRELVMKYNAENVCHEEMIKMPLVDLKVLEDGSFKMCIDYHELSKIDLYLDCHQMRVHEDEIPKTAFRIRYGRYESMAMPFWVDQCTIDFHRRNESGARVAFEDEFGAAEEREVSCEAQQGRSGVKRKLFGSCRNNIGNEPILALPEGSDNFIVMRRARVRMLA